MVCTQCQELLSEYIDGALELGEQVNIERHLADCDSCRAVRDDFLQIVHFSHQLPLQSPSPALWTRIRSDVDSLPSGVWSRPQRWLARIRTLNFNLSIPQLAAGAAALVVVVSIGAILSQRDRGSLQAAAPSVAAAAVPDITPLSNADLQQLENQISSLSATVEQKKNSWDRELRTEFERNLYYIDQSLVECRHQLKNNPADDVSQELMLNAYREKVRLLDSFDKF
jgi:putative zinc finger protein